MEPPGWRRPSAPSVSVTHGPEKSHALPPPPQETAEDVMWRGRRRRWAGRQVNPCGRRAQWRRWRRRLRWCGVAGGGLAAVVAARRHQGRVDGDLDTLAGGGVWRVGEGRCSAAVAGFPPRPPPPSPAQPLSTSNPPVPRISRSGMIADGGLRSARDRVRRLGGRTGGPRPHGYHNPWISTAYPPLRDDRCGWRGVEGWAAR